MDEDFKSIHKYCSKCGASSSMTQDINLPCSFCGGELIGGEKPDLQLNHEDINYLIDFITKTLQENDESEPFDEDEANYLLELRDKLKRS